MKSRDWEEDFITFNFRKIYIISILIISSLSLVYQHYLEEEEDTCPEEEDTCHWYISTTWKRSLSLSTSERSLYRMAVGSDSPAAPVCHILSHHQTQCHIIRHSVTSSYILSHHHTQCHIIIHAAPVCVSMCVSVFACVCVCMCVCVCSCKQILSHRRKGQGKLQQH